MATIAAATPVDAAIDWRSDIGIEPTTSLMSIGPEIIPGSQQVVSRVADGVQFLVVSPPQAFPRKS
ncbi:MAG TPA: hypothetical protein PK765_00205 [bacterium]|nr:hypothetical protein [bacterium]